MSHDDRNQLSESLESGMGHAGNMAGKAANLARNQSRHNDVKEGLKQGPSDKQGDKSNASDNREVGDKNKPQTPKERHNPSLSGTQATGSAAGGEAAAGASEAAGGAAAEGAAGSASATTAGAAAGAEAGAAAGSVVGPAGTAVGAGVGLVIAKFGKWICITIFLCILVLGGIIEELVPNIITKPVATTQSILKGAYEKAKSLISGFLDFFTGGNSEEESKTIETLEEATTYAIEVIDEILESAYEDAEEKIRQLCDSKGYDYEATMDSFQTQGGIFNSTNYAFIIATYSVTTDFTNVTVKNFKDKLRDKLDIAYTISDEGTTVEQWDPLPIYRYDPVTIRLCVDETYHSGDEDESGWTEHDYESYTVYVKSTEVDKRSDGTGYWVSNKSGEMVKNYVDAHQIPNSGHNDYLLDDRYVLGPVVGDSSEILVMPEMRTTTYGNITMTPYQNEDVYSMFEVDPDGKYIDDYETTNRQMIEMRMTMMEGLVNNVLQSSHVEYATEGLSEEEIKNYLSQLPADLSGNRKQVIKTALTLVGMVPYYYGGKPQHTGWNDNWWTQRAPDPKGRTKDGLDCSGYVQWVFATAGFNGGNLDGSLLSTGSISNLQYITRDELKPGDIGLKYQGDAKHTGIYMGNDTWIHCSSSGTVVVSPGYAGFPLYKRYKPAEMEEGNLWTESIELYSSAASSFDYKGDQWYLISQIIYQECAVNTEGTIAVAESVRNRCYCTEYPDDPLSVLTQKDQYSAYGDGDYKSRRPTTAEIELVKQAIGGTKRILNDQQILYFVSDWYHRQYFLKGKGWHSSAGLVPVGNYGDNEFYKDPKAKFKTTIPGINTSGSTGSHSSDNMSSGATGVNKKIPNNSSNMGIVYYGQSNKAGGGEWASVPFGGENIAWSGCSVTSLAMVISYLKSGSNSSEWIYPNEVVSMIASKNGGNYNAFYDGKAGQKWSIFPAVSGYYGIKCKEISSKSIINSLKDGKPVIMSCVKGEFTNGGHFIVITGVDSAGKCYVNDPSHPDKSAKTYSVEYLVTQGKGWWNFSE